jgi:hypothetical protein
MTDAADSLNQAEDDILNHEISDESLEMVAGGVNVAVYTLGFCTGLSLCPG